MSTSNYYEQKILDHMLRGQAFTPPTTIYAQIHYGNPGDNGTSSNVGIGRAVVTFTAAADNGSGGYTAQLATPVDFPNTLAYSWTATYASLWDAVSGGNCLWTGALDASILIPANHTLRLLNLSVSMT